MNFCLIKQVFIALLSFTGSFVTKYVYLNNDLCMIRPTLIDLNPVELSYYPFMISLDKCDGSFNAVDDFSLEVCAPSETNC